MSDIHNCGCCNDSVYIDNASHCVVCGQYFCPACDYENGETLYSDEQDNFYYICKDCLDQGLDYINEDNEDDSIFTEDEYNKAIQEFKKRNNL